MEKLQGTETVRDVVATLNDPEDYVRGVFGNMMAFRRRRIEPAVRIGATGEGLMPHYRIEPASTGNSLKAMADDIGSFIEHVIAFNGRNHRDMNWTAFQLQGDNWCRAVMSVDEIRTLLGELRGRGK